MNLLEEPFFTIITPNFNKGKFVQDCIQSIRNQTFESWELLFIDDSSTDGSAELAQDAMHADRRCVFLNNDTGIRGANAARNKGIKMARGAYCLFLDSDDLLAKDSLERRFQIASQHPELAYYAFPMGLFFDAVGDSDLITNIPTAQDDLTRFLDRDLMWLITGPTWKKSTLEALNGFNLDLHSHQDYDLHVRALIAGYPYRYFHQEPDSFYRRNVDSEPRKNSQNLLHFRTRKDMVLNHYALLHAADKLGDAKRLQLARYLLDLAQMMRWHRAELGAKKAKKEALGYWENAWELRLVSKSDYRAGRLYIRFKHQLRFNHLPALQSLIERRFCRRLANLIFVASKTYCQVTFEHEPR